MRTQGAGVAAGLLFAAGVAAAIGVAHPAAADDDVTTATVPAGATATTRATTTRAATSVALTIAPPPRPAPAGTRRSSTEAAFERESYEPGETASLKIFRAARGVSLQIFRIGPERTAPEGYDELHGAPVTTPRHVRVLRRGARIRVAVGSAWQSGVYFARLRAGDADAFAPFVVRPRRLGGHRVAIVMPTTTWQAYNRRDDDGDGRGDTWYADRKRDTARLARPFLNRGVPFNFRTYDLPFLRWLDVAHHPVDALTDADLDAARPDDLARAYRLVVFPGHHEYVTDHEYDVVEQYRDLGGHLMFLSANNFFWQVTRRDGTIERIRRWRTLHRPEAALVGVQYRANDRGEHRGPWIVGTAPAASWIFRGTDLAPGDAFGRGGIEIDHTTPASPPRTQVLAEIRDLFGRGRTAQMTYYETARGARVFAAGAFGLVSLPLRPEVARLLENLWQRLASASA
jgi:hypothetical protein